jgi:hypothetical protein
MDPSGLWTGTTDIGPGESLSGFSFESTGLPTIVESYFEGNAALLAFSAEPPSEMDQILDTLLTFPRNTLIQYTIGPSTPPSPFIPVAFLDTLISYKHQAFTLGWIANQGILQSLDAKLENAKAQLQRNNITSARNILQSFLNEVEALNKKGDQITSEAYALLKFNAEYLVSKL